MKNILNVFHIPTNQGVELSGKRPRPKRLTCDEIKNLTLKMTKFNKYKFVTLRPHYLYMTGRYFPNKIPTKREYANKLMDILYKNLEWLDVEALFIGGSIEHNENDPFAHIHFILECTEKNLKMLKDLVLDDITIEHKIKKVQHAFKVSKCESSNIDVMIKYYLGIKDDKLKDSYEWSLINYGALSDSTPVTVYYELIKAYKLSISIRREKSAERAEKKRLENLKKL